MKMLYGLVNVFVAALLLTLSEPASAQITGTNLTEGEPVIATSATAADSEAEYVDAYVFSGSDMCAKISAAWAEALVTQSLTSATVDARAFTGNQTCSSNPFTVSSGGKTPTPHGILLLGDVVIATSVTWVVPTQLELRGIGHGGGAGASSGYNTIISAYNTATSEYTLPSSEAVLQMGSNASGDGPWFGIKIAGLTVDCHGQSGCVGIFNNEAEENSTVEDVQIWDAPAYGLRVSAYDATNPTGTSAATNSGPYRNVYVAYTSNCSTNCSNSSTVGIEVDGYGSTNFPRSIREFDAITVSGHGAGYIAAGVVICGVSAAFTNSHIEYATTGVEIGTGPVTGTAGCDTGYSNFDTRSVAISNVSIGTTTGNSGQNAIIVGSASNSPPTGDIVISGITNQTVNTNSNTLKDHVSGTTLASTTDPFLGFYAVGHCPCGGTGQPQYPALLTTSASVGWQEPATMEKTGGSFLINHPLDPANLFLSHSFVESPDMMNIYNGSVTTDRHGLATVILPTYFEALNRDFRYQLTPLGQAAQAFVAEKVKGNRFVIKTNKPGVEVSWQVTGIRHDSYANEHRIQVEEPKPSSLRNH
jgi:hypothetical protein